LPSDRGRADNPPMLAFWPDVLEPILSALHPTSLVEIGSEAGKTTRLLLNWAKDNDARLIAIDPAPAFDIEAVQRTYEGIFQCFRLPSLVALSSVERFDVVLIDGDHNWYTVFHELQLIQTLCQQSGQPFPLVFMHDVAWPYGRRDLYYAPSTIPEPYRHPYARQGISPTCSRLLPQGGFNARMYNALEEGGPRNGVLTAVEDFLAQSEASFEWVVIPAVFGLGILLPSWLAQANPLVAQQIRVWATPEVQRFIQRLEMARIAMLTGVSA